MSGLTIVNRDGIVLEVNGFLAKGQELVLQGNDFQEGSRGIVVALLSQKKRADKSPYQDRERRGKRSCQGACQNK